MDKKLELYIERFCIVAEDHSDREAHMWAKRQIKEMCMKEGMQNKEIDKLLLQLERECRKKLNQ